MSKMFGRSRFSAFSSSSSPASFTPPELRIMATSPQLDTLGFRTLISESPSKPGISAMKLELKPQICPVLGSLIALIFIVLSFQRVIVLASTIQLTHHITHFQTLPLIQSLMEKDLDKKDKKKGGPEKVKKPAPAYFLWCKDQWNEVKKANPDAEFKEVSVILGAKWKTISPEEKKPYEEKYQAEKEAYLRIVSKEKRENEAMKLLEEEQKQKTAMELLEQYLQFKQEAEKDTKKTKKEKDPLKPKQPMSAFFVYSNERRVDLLGEGNTILEVSKITGEEWKSMTEQQKKPYYEERAKENKAKYLQEMEVYKQMKEEEEANMKREEDEHMKLQKVEALQLLKKKEKTENII